MFSWLFDDWLFHLIATGVHPFCSPCFQYPSPWVLPPKSSRLPSWWKRRMRGWQHLGTSAGFGKALAKGASQP